MYSSFPYQTEAAVSKRSPPSVTMVDSSSADGTPWRLQTKQLPTKPSTVTVRDSVAGTFMASVANGYLGTVVYSDSIHVSGVFNGKSYPKKRPIYPVYFRQHAHRARIPSTAAIEFNVPGVLGNESYALDVAEGVFYKWFVSHDLSVEQRVYAHRSRRNLLVVEITVNNGRAKELHVSFANKRGNASKDISFEEMELGGLQAKAMIGKVSPLYNHIRYVCYTRSYKRGLQANNLFLYSLLNASGTEFIDSAPMCHKVKRVLWSLA